MLTTNQIRKIKKRYSIVFLKKIIITIIFFSAFTFISSNIAYCVPSGDSLKTSSLLEKKAVRSPMQYISGDSLRSDSSKAGGPVFPGGSSFVFTPDQDSAYFLAMKLRLPAATRFRTDLINLSPGWEFHKEISKGTPWHIAVENVKSIPSKFLQPSGREIVQRKINIQNSMRVPLVHNLIGTGISIPLNSLALVLGLVEDVSPKIKYTLDYPADVEVVIYSVNAAVIATLFDGPQPVGSYTIVWNLRDDKGKPALSGDYIAEVRIGKYKYVRKRIVVP